MPTLETRRWFLLTIALIIITIAIVLSSNRSYIAATSPPQEPSSRNAGQELKSPLAAYSVKLPTDPTERQLRLNRNSRYNKRAPQTFDEMRPDTTAYSTSSHWWLDIPALPTSESDAVVVGKIVDASGYLSNDRTGAYSEFTVRVKKVFKDDGRLSTGLIIAEREGATVQLPDSRMIRYGIAGQGMPQVGQRYVLFLKYNEDLKVYDIITGYELRNNHVFPLDNVAERFTAYENNDERIFLNTVQTAVSRPPQAPQHRREINQ